MEKLVYWFEELGLAQLEQVGGKNASLGELINHLTQAGVRVPQGFAISAAAYRHFLTHNTLDKKIAQALAALDVNNLTALAQTGAQIRHWLTTADLPSSLIDAISQAYQQLQANNHELSVAIRSSATAEDLPDASFAGQQDTLLNVQGLEQILSGVKHVFASLFTDRAIAYRSHQGFDHMQVALSVGIQRMIRSDKGTSGVMFTIDTESGFDQTVFITAAYGLGESVVQGQVNPDEFYVYKPNLLAKRPAIIHRRLGSKALRLIFSDNTHTRSGVTMMQVDPIEQQRFCLTDNDVEELAYYALMIEKHYGYPMDIEWGKDGIDGKIYILQARPETVKSQKKNGLTLSHYQLQNRGTVLTKGRSVGEGIGQGTAKIISCLADMDQIQANDVLVTDMTDPDWEPIMKRASAIVTNRGGRTCHAAIIARELGIPAIVGCGDATTSIVPNSKITVSCAEGDTGFVYQGLLDFKVNQVNVETMPDLPVKIMLNVGNPDIAFSAQALPNSGVGLARLEFIINNMIGVHPQAALDYPNLPPALMQRIAKHTCHYASPAIYYQSRLQEGIATIAAAFYPKPVIVRLSDFKSNEYAHLIGGEQYEPQEANPMLGFRGACRYLAPHFHGCFALECQALRYVREDMGLSNIAIMVPFVRTPSEASAVIELLAAQGLQRGKHGLAIYMMCELPTNALLADTFLTYFDGFSIGSNDLTQLTLGLDRDSGLLAHHFDERDLAVKLLLQQAIRACKKAGKYVGLCGQGPSDHPDFAKWLMDEGIDSLSLNPDSVIATWLALANANSQA